MRGQTNCWIDIDTRIGTSWYYTPSRLAAAMDRFEAIFRDGRGSPEHLALMKSITKERKSGGWNDNDEDGEEDVDEVMRKEEKRDGSSIGLTLPVWSWHKKRSNQKAG